MDKIAIKLNSDLTKSEIIQLLALDDFTPVYEAADRVRAENVGDVVHLRAIIEFSNICKRQCIYCGLNRDNEDLPGKDRVVKCKLKP